MKILYLVLAGGSLGHDQHKKSQIETWATNSNRGTQVIWMHGNTNVPAATLVGDDLFLPVEEKYENLLEKTILGLRWVLENLEFDYLVRTNTSNYFHEKLLRVQLAQLESRHPVAAGVKAKWKGTILGKKWFHRYISGAGIYLSRSAAQILCRMDASDFVGVPDDVAIGHYLRVHKVKFKSISRNNITDYKPIWPMPQTRVKSWSDEQKTIARMHAVHQIYSSRNKEELSSLLKIFINSQLKDSVLEKPRRASLLQFQYRTLDSLIRFRFNKVRNLM